MAYVTNLRDAFSFSFDILRVIKFFKYVDIISDNMTCNTVMAKNGHKIWIFVLFSKFRLKI